VDETSSPEDGMPPVSDASWIPEDSEPLEAPVPEDPPAGIPGGGAPAATDAGSDCDADSADSDADADSDCDADSADSDADADSDCDADSDADSG